MDAQHSPAAFDPDALSDWTGRIDGDGAEHARWHQRVQPAAIASGTGSADNAGAADGAGIEHIAVLGFRSHEGVRRNNGRIGAADGPAALRRALSPLALHGPLASGGVQILDYGDAVTDGEDLEGGQRAAAELTCRALDAPGNLLTVVLGGGHETAWSSYLGLQEAARMRQGAHSSAEGMGSAGPGTAAESAGSAAPATPVEGAGGPAQGEGAPGRDPAPASRPRWGVLNLDAHFDLRRADRPTSGTPFLQMAEAEAEQGRDLAYCVLGIAEPSNTGVLFAEAERLGVTWRTDVQLAEMGAEGIRQVVADFAADLDVLYLTVDLDVLPASVAPGVSAPAALGVDPALILIAVRAAAATGKLALLDVVELNPSLDQDGRTAKTAARLIDEAVRVLV